MVDFTCILKTLSPDIAMMILILWYCRPNRITGTLALALFQFKMVRNKEILADLLFLIGTS